MGPLGKHYHNYLHACKSCLLKAERSSPKLSAGINVRVTLPPRAVSKTSKKRDRPSLASLFGEKIKQN